MIRHQLIITNLSTNDITVVVVSGGWARVVGLLKKHGFVRESEHIFLHDRFDIQMWEV